jgi:hypothetical protein
MTTQYKQPRNLLPSRANATDLLLGEGFRGFFITQMTEEKRKEKRRAASLAYYAANKEKVKAATAAYYAANKEKRQAVKAAYLKQYRALNPEKVKAASAAWRALNPEKVKAASADYYAKNREKEKVRHLKWRTNNNDRHKANSAKWRKQNVKRVKENTAKWRKENPEKVKFMKLKNKKQRLANDPIYAMAQRFRRRLSLAIKANGFKKHSCTEKMLGCTFKQFAKHIESQFTDGMGWDNRSEWHLDHIVPLSCATTIEGLEKLSHYKNIRPLWAADNLIKSNKLVLV